MKATQQQQWFNSITTGCSKKGFKSLLEANTRLFVIQSQDKKTPLKRAYKCLKCKKYHLTSKLKIPKQNL